MTVGLNAELAFSLSKPSFSGETTLFRVDVCFNAFLSEIEPLSISSEAEVLTAEAEVLTAEAEVLTSEAELEISEAEGFTSETEVRATDVEVWTAVVAGVTADAEVSAVVLAAAANMSRIWAEMFLCFELLKLSLQKEHLYLI